MGALTVTWKKFQMRDYYDSDKRQNGKPSTMKYAKMSTLTRSERNAFGIVNAFKRRRLENQSRYFKGFSRNFAYGSFYFGPRKFWFTIFCTK